MSTTMIYNKSQIFAQTHFFTFQDKLDEKLLLLLFYNIPVSCSGTMSFHQWIAIQQAGENLQNTVSVTVP